MDDLKQQIERLEAEKAKLLKEIKFLNHGEYIDCPDLLKENFPEYFEDEEKDPVTNSNGDKRPSFEQAMGWVK